MKIILSLLLLTFSLGAAAQQYKIVVSYDPNGNRTKRERICFANCPPPPGAMPDGNAHTAGNNDVMPGTDGNPYANKAGFHLFPNPANGILNLQLDNRNMLDQQCEFIVLDVMGRELLHKPIGNVTSQYDISGLADGMYMCIVVTGDQRAMVRISKKTQ